MQPAYLAIGSRLISCSEQYRAAKVRTDKRLRGALLPRERPRCWRQLARLLISTAALHWPCGRGSKACACATNLGPAGWSQHWGCFKCCWPASGMVRLLACQGGQHTTTPIPNAHRKVAGWQAVSQVTPGAIKARDRSWCCGSWQLQTPGKQHKRKLGVVGRLSPAAPQLLRAKSTPPWRARLSRERRAAAAARAKPLGSAGGGCCVRVLRRASLVSPRGPGAPAGGRCDLAACCLPPPAAAAAEGGAGGGGGFCVKTPLSSCEQHRPSPGRGTSPCGGAVDGGIGDEARGWWFGGSMFSRAAGCAHAGARAGGPGGAAEVGARDRRTWRG